MANCADLGRKITVLSPNFCHRKKFWVTKVAIVLKSNKDYVYNLIKAGVLPAIKLGRLKVLKSTLERFLKEYEWKDLSNPFNVADIKFK